MNNDLLVLIDSLTLIIMSIFLFNSIYCIWKKKGKTVHLVYIIIYIIYNYQIIYNLFSDYNYYSKFQGFIISQYDVKTCLLTDLFLIIMSIILFVFGKDNNKNNALLVYDKNEFIIKNKVYENVIRIILIIVMIYPTIKIVTSGNISYFLDYAEIALNPTNFNYDVIQLYNEIFNQSFISIICVGIYILIRRKINLFDFIVLSFITMLSIYFNGKRNIVIISIIVILICLYIKQKISSKVLLILSSILVAVFMIYSVLYVDVLKSEYSSNNIFENLYIDIGRTDRLKMVIYSLLNSEQIKILDYMGQTFIFTIFAFVPRTLWPLKGYPYYNYFSYKLFFPSSYEIPYDKIRADWITYGLSGMTTSFFDEIIANFSWLGFIIGPFIIAKLCKYADKANILVKLLTIFLITQLVRNVISPVQFYMWVLVVLIYKIKDKERKI
ncbi:O-antigen polysaccharide polymerase Wzy [Clostridium perfringens]|nr:O-antigen polysaccharide polymerase Wzy [Clostridium perfringens]